MGDTRITVASDNRHLISNGAPFFYFADTVWNAFACATKDEWKKFTAHRGEQGFNALQYSALPVLHDASDTYVGETPFAENNDGSWDFSKPSKSYFEKAEEMVDIGLSHGLRPCITVIWNNYIENTWAHERRPEVYIPSAAVEDYTAMIAERFAKFEPIYFISGDTSFETDEISDQFFRSMKAVKIVDPSALTAMHVTGGNNSLPRDIVESELLDLYIYQSGHNLGNQDNTFIQATEFYNRSPVRPVINAEPCYEGHGHGNRYGRFDAASVRRAFWWSVLSGAHAGFTYGAHGVWSWHREGAAFTSEGWSMMPFDWKTAIHLQGSSDAAYCVSVYREQGMHALEPAQHLMTEGKDQIRMAASANRELAVIYIPYTTSVTIDGSFGSHSFSCIDLTHRERADLPIQRGDTGIHIPMRQVNGDYLIIARNDV